MVGTTRFELATSPTPRVRSTRLSHVPTIDLHVIREGDGGVSCRLKCTRLATCATHLPYRVGATYSFGNEPPSPKKNSFICSTRNSCASRVHGCNRYSFNSIFCRSTHSPQDFFETFLKIFWPKSESNGGSSSPSISALNLVSKTMCAIVCELLWSFHFTMRVAISLHPPKLHRIQHPYERSLRHCDRSYRRTDGRQRVRRRCLRASAALQVRRQNSRQNRRVAGPHTLQSDASLASAGA